MKNLLHRFTFLTIHTFLPIVTITKDYGLPKLIQPLLRSRKTGKGQYVNCANVERRIQNWIDAANVEKNSQQNANANEAASTVAKRSQKVSFFAEICPFISVPNVYQKCHFFTKNHLLNALNRQAESAFCGIMSITKSYGGDRA